MNATVQESLFCNGSIWLIQMKEIHNKWRTWVHETWFVIRISRGLFSREKVQVQIDIYFLNRGDSVNFIINKLNMYFILSYQVHWDTQHESKTDNCRC